MEELSIHDSWIGVKITCGLILSRVQVVHSNVGLICLLMPCAPWVIGCQPFLTLSLNNVTVIDCLQTKKLSIA